MSAIETHLIRIAVTNGDVLLENKPEGKSNTGTYFISSEKEYLDTFKNFIDDSGQRLVTYFLDIDRIKGYCSSFEVLVLPLDEFKFARGTFESKADYFKNQKGYHEIVVSTRKNDSRVFLQLKNKEPIIEALRGILYSNISILVVEKIDDNNFSLYPEINYSCFKK